MSTTAPAATPTATANEYQLHDHSGNVEVTYYPFAPGPIIQNRVEGALLNYTGPAGTLSFRGSDVQSQDTPLGQMLTVVLKPQNDAGEELFTIFLPNIALGTLKSEKFNTFAVTTTKPGGIVPASAQIHYEVERMHGTAKNVPLAL
jgi:hypothetical protein